MEHPRGRRSSPGRRVVLAAALLVLAVASSAAACQTTVGDATPTAAGLAWTEIALPQGVQPVTLAAAGDAILIGALAAERPRPRLFLARGDSLTQVVVEPSSPYAFVARWLSIAVHDDRVVAVAGARGGAHANVRWTVWQGALGPRPRLVEQPQPFGVFGGWGAGDLTGAAFAGEDPVVVGAWASARTGNDVSLWRVAGDRWDRQDSTGTPLGSSPEALNGARSVTALAPAGLALVGSVTDLATGTVRSVPALWTAPAPAGPWTLVRLPSSQPIAEAHSARCDESGCLVVGVDGDVLTVWQTSGSTATRQEIPSLTVGDHQAAPPPVRLGGRTCIVAPGVLLERVGSGWRSRPGPAGAPVAAAALGDTIYLVTTVGDTLSRLWSARP